MSDREEAAARLIERVLSDAAFRARFRRDPEAAARELGLDPAEAPAADSAFETLELRESKSSLAGAMLAAAVEGVGIYDYVDHLAGGHQGASAAAASVGPAHVAAAEEVGGDDAASDDSADDAESEDGASESDDGPESDDGGDADESDGPGSDDDAESDDDESDDDSEDEEGDDEEEDEDEPDEVGPDIDDLTDDEVVEGESGESSDSDSDDGDSDSDSDDGDSDDGDSSDGDSGGGGSVGNLGDIDSAYPGDDAPREKIALWMAAEAQRRGLPPELPVMAALVESGMRNLPGGDADSVGLFQMRASIWDSGDYAGYAGRPELQLDWFLDHAEAVRAQRVAGGLSIKDPDQYGEWIADVERPAEQYRGRYQEQLAEARDLLHHQPNAPADDLVDGGDGELKAGSRARAALAEAKKYLGTPYQWGGSTPKTGFDCSGLVQWAYAQEGVRIPRVTDQQILAEGATKVGRDDLLPGDLVFFRDSTGYVHHVGISLGGDRFLHAPHTGDVVKISSLKESYYSEQFTGGRRFVPAVHAPDDQPADASEVAKARAAVERDDEEVHRSGTALFRAIEVQEQHKQNYAQVLPVIRPDQVRRN